MSTPRTLVVERSVRRADIVTPRGTFATWTCSRGDLSLARGNVLLVPGFTGSKEDFAPLLPLLADAGWDVATLDQRGQFETQASPDHDFSLQGFAADLVAVTAGLFDHQRRTHLVGHSLGGLVAAVAAIEHPDCWASLTLMCSGPGAIEGTRGEQAMSAARLVEEEGLAAAWSAKQRDSRERGVPRSAPDVEDFLYRRFMANAPASLAAMSRHVGSTPDLTAALKGLEVPVAVVRGEYDDAWPHEVQDRLAEGLGTRVVVVAGAAHSPAVEEPELTRDALVRGWVS